MVARSLRETTHRRVLIPPMGLEGFLYVPDTCRGCVIFVHGSGSSRLSPRNQEVARFFHEHEMATLLFDLLREDEGQDRRKVFDIDLLTTRLRQAREWVGKEASLEGLAVGLFGASTGAATALRFAAEHPNAVCAVVSRGGRPDLAGHALAEVQAPTLLIVGGDDRGVIELNEMALDALGCERKLAVVPGAGHLFEEPGTLRQAASLARDWFLSHFESHQGEEDATS